MSWQTQEKGKSRQEALYALGLEVPARGTNDLQLEVAAIVHRQEVVAVGGTIGDVLDIAVFGEEANLDLRVINLILIESSKEKKGRESMRKEKRNFCRRWR
jgi:hypothetical protein